MKTLGNNLKLDLIQNDERAQHLFILLSLQCKFFQHRPQ